jgi:hypothetical protein
VLDDGRDDDLVRRRERAAHVEQVERIGEPDVQRSGAIAPSGECGHAVRDRACLAARQPVDHESGAAPELPGELVLEHQ